jgi:hypothetical protein
MKKNFLKFAAFAMLAMVSTSAMADDVLKATDATAEAGNTGTFTLSMETDKDNVKNLIFNISYVDETQNEDAQAVRITAMEPIADAFPGGADPQLSHKDKKHSYKVVLGLKDIDESIQAGDIAKFTVEVADGTADGDYEMKVTNTELTYGDDPMAQETTAPAEFNIKVTVGATGIENISVEKENTPVYNLNGMQVSNLQKGVYVRNGKKYIVK